MEFTDKAAEQQVRSNLSEANHTLEKALGVAHQAPDRSDHVYLAFRAHHTSLVLLNTLRNGRPSSRKSALMMHLRALWALTKVALNAGERAETLHQTYEEWREVRHREEVRRRRNRYVPLCPYHFQ